MMLSILSLILMSCVWARVPQVELSRVNQMVDVPQPLKIIDYKSLALDFDKKVFDFNAKEEYWPLVWIDQNRSNFNQTTVGLFTTIGDVRQGPSVNKGAFHEALGTMGAVLGATLVGVDKTKGDVNFVASLRNYFNKKTGWYIMQNNTTPEAGAQGGGYGRDWWYDVYPNLLFYAIYEKYPNIFAFEQFAKKIADQFYEADKILKGNYQFSYFNYRDMKPVKNWICAQPDVAAGHSYVLYAAYKKFGDKRYLEGAVSSLRALSKNKMNPSYEVLMPFGALMAARLNAEEGHRFDVRKMLDWTFDGTAVCREGWGVLVGNWNGFDVSGLMGSTVDHGGYGFLMNTYDLAWPLLPLVRYDQSFAQAVGKWMLNAANAAKLMYPDHIPSQHQTIPELAHLTKGVIAYEGLVKKSTHEQYAHLEAPVAQGDGPKWIEGNPDVTQFSVYGSAHVGIFGSTIERTDVEGILKLDLLATDFFREKAYPTYLIYNPYAEARSVTLNVRRSADLYDSVSGQFIMRNVSGKVKLALPAKTPMVVVFTPVAGEVKTSGHKLLVNDVVVDYRYEQTKK